jgi:uncharacterized membrane protein
MTTTVESPRIPRQNGLGTAALVLGIVGILLSFFLVGGLLGLVGIGLGFVGLSRVKQGLADNRTVAIAGIVTGIIAVLVAASIVAIGASFFVSHKKEISDYQRCLDRANSQPARDDCARQFNTNVRNG